MDDQGVRNIRVLVAGTAVLKTVEIIKNNQVIHCDSPKKDYSEILFEDAAESGAKEDFYYVRVSQKDYASAWSSPIWVKNS